MIISIDKARAARPLVACYHRDARSRAQWSLLQLLRRSRVSQPLGCKDTNFSGTTKAKVFQMFHVSLVVFPFLDIFPDFSPIALPLPFDTLPLVSHWCSVGVRSGFDCSPTGVRSGFGRPPIDLRFPSHSPPILGMGERWEDDGRTIRE